MTETVKSRANTPAWWRFLPLLAIALGFGAFFGFGFGDYLSFEALTENRGRLLDWRDDNLALAAVVFMAAYAALTAFSVPVGLWMTLAGGFMFGIIAGGFLSLFAATVGATAIFLAARYAFADFFRDKAGAGIAKMEAGFREDELTYMFILRLVPLFPFWLVNLVPAFLGVSTRTYVLGTFFGMIPGALVYASVGNGLGAVFEAGGEPDLGIIFSPPVLLPILGLALLSLIPVVYKKLRKSKD
ncbi:MAG: TVP38/TMEM64 family protein [Alphaproteobacteria bacterium]